VKKNNKLIGWIDVMDEIRPEAKEVIEWFNSKGIKTIMLTGDMKHKAEQIAGPIAMSMVYAEKSPAEKMEIISSLNNESPTAMVGDGINDAPALAKATIGISIGKASQLAVQNADVILMSGGLKNLPLAMGLGKHTFITIRRNLFWAFSYNIIAIPIAAAGLLSPSFSAFTMGFSDLMLAFISLHLFIKKVV
jgi:Cu+-exporting ATPase